MAAAHFKRTIFIIIQVKPLVSGKLQPEIPHCFHIVLPALAPDGYHLEIVLNEEESLAINRE